MSKGVEINAKKPEGKIENSGSKAQKPYLFLSYNSPVNQILSLQRTLGNQAIQRLIKEGALQAKLKIGQPGDKYEQEADRVAGAVMRMPEPQAYKQPEEEEEKKGEELVQTKPLAEQITHLKE